MELQVGVGGTASVMIFAGLVLFPPLVASSICPGLRTRAIFVRVCHAGVLAESSAGAIISGNREPAARVSVRVHSNPPVMKRQLHQLPLGVAVSVTPAGIEVSRTVVVPLAAAGPRLSTWNMY